MRKFSADEVKYIVESSVIAVVHLDAEWDGYRFTIEQKMDEVLAQHPTDVAFAYVDVDEQVKFARLLKVINIPAVVYFRNGKPVGSVIGQGQDIKRPRQRT